MEIATQAHVAHVQKEAWVQCERCEKWRRVPEASLHELDDRMKWYCEMNAHSIYNSCDAPQELTNEEIDDQIHALGEAHPPLPLPPHEPPNPTKNSISHGFQRDSLVTVPKRVSWVERHGGRCKAEKETRLSERKTKAPVWQLIQDNIYTHRKRKSQDEDDIMICQCKPIWATDTSSVGCGEDCLNRMLNIECVPEYCPTGERCTNRMFTKREYAKLEVKRAGGKGFGLFAAQDLQAGDFVIEYVGEVLEEEEYMRRKEFYISTGQRHYYFMNIGNGEVIDACRKGGPGRFINHSCDPNCETQKWVVGGELTIGLFTTKAVKEGTELTFDYNFERYGDKPMKCLCDSQNCRGFIGGTQESIQSLLALQASDKDAPPLSIITCPDGGVKDPVPIMVTEKDVRGERDIHLLLDRAIGIRDTKKKVDTTRVGKKLKNLALAQKDGTLFRISPTSPVEERAGGASGTTRRPFLLPSYKPRKTTHRDEDRESIEESISTEYCFDEDEEEQSGDGLEGAASLQHTPPEVSALAGASLTTPMNGEAVSAGDPKSTQKTESSRPLLLSGGTPSSSTATTTTLLTTHKMKASSAAQHRKRSEIDRRVDMMVGSTGRLRDISKSSIIRFLRLFNLCSQVERGMTASNGMPHKRSQRSRLHGDFSLKISDRTDGGSLNNTLVSKTMVGHTHQRDRARVADFSLLLDVVLKTGAPAARRTFVACGLLRQLLGIIGGATPHMMSPHGSYSSGGGEVSGGGSMHAQQHSQYSIGGGVVLRKVLRVVDALPLTPEDVSLTRSAHGSFRDLLRELTQHKDYEVRNSAWLLCRKFPPLSTAAPPQGDGDSLGRHPRQSQSLKDPTPPHKKPPPHLPPNNHHPLSSTHYHTPSTSEQKKRDLGRADDEGSLYWKGSLGSLEQDRVKRTKLMQEELRNGCPMLSPMTDDEDEEEEEGEAKVVGVGEWTETGKKSSEDPLVKPDTGGEKKKRSAALDRWEDWESWDKPDEDFADFVAENVRLRVGKYVDHPSSLGIGRDDADRLYSKVKREVMAKELKAYDERQVTGMYKPIEKEKLAQKIGQFVKESIRRHVEKKESM